MSKETNEIKVISHASAIGKTHGICPDVCYCNEYEMSTVEEVVENQRVVKKGAVKKVNPCGRYEGMKASDFALENIIAVGALDSLKECQLRQGTLNVADGVEASVDNIINAVENESINNSNDGGNE